MNTKTLFAKVVGVTYENRQSIIATLTGKEPCRLVPEPENKFDPNAIAVHVATKDGVKHIGFIKKELAATVAPLMEGEPLMCKISGITGGFDTPEGKAALGVTLAIEIPSDDNPIYELPYFDKNNRLSHHPFTVEDVEWSASTWKTPDGKDIPFERAEISDMLSDYPLGWSDYLPDDPMVEVQVTRWPKKVTVDCIVTEGVDDWTGDGDGDGIIFVPIASTRIRLWEGTREDFANNFGNILKQVREDASKGIHLVDGRG